MIYCYLELLCSLTHLLVYFCLLSWNMSHTSASFNALFPILSVALYIVFLNSYFTVFLAIKRELQYLASTSVNCYRSAISINIRNVHAFWWDISVSRCLSYRYTCTCEKIRYVQRCSLCTHITSLKLLPWKGLLIRLAFGWLLVTWLVSSSLNGYKMLPECQGYFTHLKYWTPAL